MKNLSLASLLAALALSLTHIAHGGGESAEDAFFNPPDNARSWVFWYWMEASVSREGIRADLEAMAQSGIAGAYLMPIKGPADPPHMEPVNQLSPEWWAMVKFAFEEASRLGLKLTLHACDGFAVAGGPWVTPELSMQKIVWTETFLEGGQALRTRLPQPETLRGYYQDIAAYAFPAPRGYEIAAEADWEPVISVSLPDVDASFLTDGAPDASLRMAEPGWIQYAFDEPFTLRSVTIHPRGNNYSAKRLQIEVSDDGKTFFPVRQLEPPRHGWQDTEAPLTWSVPETRARYFRFVHDPAGAEPGAEDLDSAKWKPVLGVRRIELSSVPRIHQYEGKSGAVWRISKATTERQIPFFDCVDPASIIRLDAHIDAGGRLSWEAPAGDWVVVRMGHTSTGKENYIGGAGKGLEIDKFNPDAAKLQYDRWFGEAVRQIGPELAENVLHGFHVDSWECGSQNWSPRFREAFMEQHGYDPLDWLPVMAGVPVKSAQDSEAFLYDVRQTISSLLNRNFFGTLKDLVEADGYVFSAEATAPTMVGDGMLHYSEVDLPMGEFWLRSPSHDKPNDILDAISGGHVYGRPVIQAEAFTQVRMAWDEHPGNIKALGDRNLARGINRFVFHVFTHNPWLDRMPGMTLDGVGLYFQRDQTWWKAGRAWLEYLERCQALLQRGLPVADLAVFTGEGLPRRSVLPDRLVGALPGLIGDERVKAVRTRLENIGQPLREIPRNVHVAANMEDPADWNDPLGGYAYDSLNPDAILRLASVKDGRIVLPGGASYGMLVLPGPRRMAPRADLLSPAIIRKLYRLAHDGATILFEDKPGLRPQLEGSEADAEARRMLRELWTEEPAGTIGMGRVLRGPWKGADLESLAIDPAFLAFDNAGRRLTNMSWCQRRTADGSIYFIVNPDDKPLSLRLSLRESGKRPRLLDPVRGIERPVPAWEIRDGRTGIELELDPRESVFVLLTEKTDRKHGSTKVSEASLLKRISGPWEVQFDPRRGGPTEAVPFTSLQSWTGSGNAGIRHYSGTAVYGTAFRLDKLPPGSARVELDLGRVEDIAEVRLNGISCGVAWTAPRRVDVTEALKKGENILRIEVTNTWANRLIGDHALPEDERITRTRAPYRLGDGPLLPAGLLGPVKLLIYR